MYEAMHYVTCVFKCRLKIISLRVCARVRVAILFAFIRVCVNLIEQTSLCSHII